MEGKPVVNDAAPMSPQAPQQTAPISKGKQLLVMVMF